MHSATSNTEIQSSPFDVLPVELISAIFELSLLERSKARSFCPPTFVPQLDGEPSRLRRLSTISQLNRRLRSIAIETPPLWSLIQLSGKVTTSMGRLHTFLTRSKASLLDIELDAKDVAKVDGGNEVLLEMLCSEMTRWRSFRLNTERLDALAAEEFITSLNQFLCRGDLMELCTIDVASSALSPSCVISDPRSANIRDLALSGIGFNWSMVSSTYDQLRRISLSNLSSSIAPSSSQLLSLISTSPLIEEIKLTNVDSSDDVESTPGGPSNIIKLSHLQSLTLEQVPLSFVSRILSTLDIPSLSHMKLCPQESSESIDWTVPFPSYSSVKTFQWSFGKMDSDAALYHTRACFSQIIRRLPNVTSMTVSSRPAVELLHDLSISSSFMPTPKLTDLSFTDAKDCLETIVSMIKARTSSTRKIQTLALNAEDLSLPRSAGQKRLEAVDDFIQWLRKSVEVLDIRAKQDKNAFRYTFLGWKDCIAHSTYGRDLEYEQEMEE